MASLITILKDILIKEESVTVPGFGTFETAYQSAQLDEKTGVIHPPTKSVTLNTEKTEDPDNKLVTAITKLLAISDVDAKAIIDDFVKTAKAKIADKQELSIDEVGIISADESGKAVLKSVASKLSIDNYGMDTVEVEPVAAADRVLAAVAAPTSKGKQTKTDTKTTTVSTTKVTTTETKTVTTGEKKKSNGLLRLLIILLPILAILTILFFIFKPQILSFLGLDGSKANEPVIEQMADVDDIAPVPEDLNVIEQEEPQRVAIDDDGATDPDLAILAKAGFSNVSPKDLGSKYKKYYLIGGSFRDKANANKVKRELQASEILKVEDSEYYRVVIIGSDNAQEIVDAYNTALSRGLKPTDLWLLKNSKN